MISHNICFHGEIRKNKKKIQYCLVEKSSSLSGAMGLHCLLRPGCRNNLGKYVSCCIHTSSLSLIGSTLGKLFCRQHIEIFFFYFSQKTRFDSSCKLSPMEAVCMNSQILFFEKNKKIFQYVVCRKVYPECCTNCLQWRLALVAQLDALSDWRPGGGGFNPRQGRQHSFVEIDHEIFSMVILSLPLIQEGQLSVSGERMCTIVVNRLED